MLKSYTIVLFGATGFIGYNLYQALRGKVENIYPVADSPREFNGVKIYHISDLKDTSFPKNTIAINVAACRYNATNHQNFKSTICTQNGTMYMQFYDWCLRKGIKEVRFAGSIAVYEEGKQYLDDNSAIDYNVLPYKSEGLYGLSKRFAELLAKSYYQEYGINTIIFRLSNPYGPYDCIDYKKAHVLPALILKSLVADETLKVLGNMKASRDFIFISDICKIFINSLSYAGVNDSFNLATGENTSIIDLAQLIIGKIKKNLRILNEGESTSSVIERFCEVDKIKNFFNIDTFVTLEKGLDSTIDWYKNNFDKSYA